LRKERAAKIPTSKEASLSGKPPSHRRSQRLLIQIPVVVSGQVDRGTPFSEETNTVVLNAHGALVQLNTVVQIGQKITLQNVRSQETQEVTIVFVAPAEGRKSNVALEFTRPRPDFWHVAFPPEDWP
jgi:hypothetical protein